MSREIHEWKGDTQKDYERFFSNIKYLCKEKEISIGDLEESVGVSKGYLSRMKKDCKSISLCNAYLLAQSIGVSLDDLLKQDMCRKSRIKELEEELARLKAEEE